MHEIDMLRLVEDTIALLMDKDPSPKRNAALEKWTMFRDKLAKRTRPVPMVTGQHMQTHEGSLV